MTTENLEEISVLGPENVISSDEETCATNVISEYGQAIYERETGKYSKRCHFGKIFAPILGLAGGGFVGMVLDLFLSAIASTEGMHYPYGVVTAVGAVALGAIAIPYGIAEDERQTAQDNLHRIKELKDYAGKYDQRQGFAQGDKNSLTFGLSLEEEKVKWELEKDKLRIR